MVRNSPCTTPWEGAMNLYVRLRPPTLFFVPPSDKMSAFISWRPFWFHGSRVRFPPPLSPISTSFPVTSTATVYYPVTGPHDAHAPWLYCGENEAIFSAPPNINCYIHTLQTSRVHAKLQQCISATERNQVHLFLVLSETRR